MPRITKGQAAAAASELECIRELAGESDTHGCFKFHALSAQRHIATLAAFGATLPTWVVRDWNYFKALGWIPSHVARPEPRSIA